MTTGRSHGHFKFKAALIGVLLFSVSSLLSVSHAQVTADTSPQGNLGTMVTAGPNFDITGGTRPNNGPNLFHSFSTFSLGSTETANFMNNSALPTTNILSRVTGGDPSNIFGTIQTNGFPGANLFLMNPAGILFGPSAQLNVEGSFHATTADYIRLGNEGGIFYADPAQPTLLSVAAPSAFGFLSANPASIDVQAGNVFESDPLFVPEDETLSFVGGTLNLGAAEVRNEAGEIVEDAKPASIVAPGGRINLVSVASPGEATLSNSAINVDGFSQLGDININGGDIFGGEVMLPTYIDGKEVFIQGGQLVMDNALIWPALFSVFGLGPPANGGEVNIAVSGDVSITGTDVEPFLGNAPGIFTLTGKLSSPPEDLPDAKGPDVMIQAASLTISGAASIQTARAGPGEPSNVTISANTVTVENGGSISLINMYEGPGGALTINAQEVNLANDGTPSATGEPGLVAQNLIHFCFACELPSGDSDFDPRLTFADAGSITVNATDQVNISGDAKILTDSLAFGRGGDITVNTGDLTITGIGPFTAGIQAQTAFAGDAGDITINASGTISLADGARIGGSTLAGGNSSNINVSAGKSITFTGADSRIANATGPATLEEQNDVFTFAFGVSFSDLLEAFGLPPDASLFDLLAVLNEVGIFAVPDQDLTPGDAGITTVTTPVLTLNEGTRILMSTGWAGNAGTVTANVGSLSLIDGGQILSQSGIERVDTGELVVGPGNAGAVNVNATDTISISGSGSAISTSTFGDGNGGDVSLNAANQIQINNGGSVTADSFGAGLTGDIAMTAGNSISLSNGTISTRAETSDGGNIKLTVPGQQVYLVNSQITTSVESGVGGGGNINIDPQFLILNSSQITANAFGGPGGNISLTANNFIPSADSTVEASSALSTQGTIVIQSPENDIAGSIAQLPQSIVDVSGLLPGSCAARHASGGAQSSFVVAGRGGLPTNPDNYLPSFGAGSAPMRGSGTTTPGTSLSELGYTNQTTVAMAGWGCLP